MGTELTVTFIKSLSMCYSSVSCLLYLEENFQLTEWSLLFNPNEMLSVQMCTNVLLASSDGIFV